MCIMSCEKKPHASHEYKSELATCVNHGLRRFILALSGHGLNSRASRDWRRGRREGVEEEEMVEEDEWMDVKETCDHQLISLHSLCSMVQNLSQNSRTLLPYILHETPSSGGVTPSCTVVFYSSAR